MFRGGHVLALVPARGGSKSLPRKNVLSLGGKPMIAWSVEAARAVSEIDRVIVSSDDAEIIAAAVAAGAEAPFVRPAALARDDSSSADVAVHAIEAASRETRPEWLVLLQPTSPLRTAEDISRAFAALERTGADSVVSLAPSPKSPHWMYNLTEEGRMKPILSEDPTATRRQDLPPVYVLNGAVYIVRVEDFLATRSFLASSTIGFVMPAERSVDVDTALDFAACEHLIGAGRNPPVPTK